IVYTNKFFYEIPPHDNPNTQFFLPTSPLSFSKLFSCFRKISQGENYSLAIYVYSFTFNNRKLFNVTSNVAPISANMAIQSVNQLGITNNNAIALIAKEKVIFCLIIAKDLRLNLTVYGNLLKSSDIKATSAVSNAVSVPAPPMATPTEEAASAGASFTPSPIIATPLYFSRRALMK